MKKVFNLSCILALCIVLFSCVSQKKFNELQKKCNEESTALGAKNLDLTNDLTELKAKISKTQLQIESLKSDTTALGLAIRTVNSNYLDLKSNYELLTITKDKMQAGTNAEMQKIMKDLQAAQTELLKKEDDLKLAQNDLNLKKENLDKLNSDLALKEAKLKDLQDILFRKDSIVNALKKKVSDALFGFENKGLSISKKNGKVYVSLDESLLFASGSTEVAPNGITALKKLAKVLEDNVDINILIEGHTDNIPYKGVGTMKDNWDLSVMRATTVLKIIVNNSKINPTRLTAAGRSQYLPIDNANTSEGRSKNRRTEIILSPKLDELLNILESN